jgi:hypothetical protein
MRRWRKKKTERFGMDGVLFIVYVEMHRLSNENDCTRSNALFIIAGFPAMNEGTRHDPHPGARTVDLQTDNLRLMDPK